MWLSQKGACVEIKGNKHFQTNQDIVTLKKFELTLELSPKGHCDNAIFHMLPISLMSIYNIVIM